jgi:hypothetical protein
VPRDLGQLERYRHSLTASVRDAGAQLSLALDPDWADRAADVLREFAASGEEFDAEDIRAVVGDPDSPGAMGAVFLQASRAKLIEPVGISRSTRIERHGGWARTWRGRTSKRPDPKAEAPAPLNVLAGSEAWDEGPT